MRTLEIILVVVLAVRITALFFPRARWIDWVSLGCSAVALLQIGVEGYRWQMIPLYGIALGVGIAAIWRLTRPKSRLDSPAKWRIASGLSGILILGIAILPPVLLPIPSTPQPSGPYPVGTISMMLTDSSRNELYSGVAGEPRRIMVQIWYPADPEPGAEPALWMEHAAVFGPAMSAYLEFPSFFLDHLVYSHAHSYQDAPMLPGDQKFPLLLFSHGWNGFRVQNTFQAEELASQGYIVAAPDHTYGAVATVFPDGQVALNNPKALPTGMGLSEADYLAAAHQLGRQWAGDLSFILDDLEGLQPGDPAGKLQGRIDFDRVGALGHSTGGGAAIEFCATDLRCKAALGMDPYMDPVSDTVLDEGLKQPYLAMFSEVWHQRENEQFNRFYANHRSDIFQFAIQGTAHFDFTDLPAFSPLAHALGLKGPLKGSRVSQIVKDYTLAFFDRYFNGIPTNLLDGASPAYPELIW